LRLQKKEEMVAKEMVETKTKILCVEDEPGMLDLLRLILESAGYGFLSAKDGEEGLAMMRSEQPDLVLLDLMLPKMDGAEVLLRKAEDPTIQSIPVIAVTALASPFDQIMWQEHTEIKDYVTKPFMRKQLLGRIERALSRKAENQEA
jgi:DNA-binding response OmpR family regulator